MRQIIFILLPAYNEEKNLVKIFKKIKTLTKLQKNIKVVLVDDFSSDNTERLSKKKYTFQLYYIRHKFNKGLSITMETGFREILKRSNEKDIVITTKSRLIKEDQKIILITSQKGF